MDSRFIHAVYTRNWRTIAPHAHGVLRPSVSSPYFQTTETRKGHTGGNIRLFPDHMKAILNNYTFHTSPSIGTSVNVGFFNGATFVANDIVPILGVNFDTDDLPAAVTAAIIAWASTNSYGTLTATDVIGVDYLKIPSGLANAPQAAIADAPADATTNYNTVTTLLGALTGAVNTANTKQNDIATRLNSLLSELRTLGLIST